MLLSDCALGSRLLVEWRVSIKVGQAGGVDRLVGFKCWGYVVKR